MTGRDVVDAVVRPASTARPLLSRLSGACVEKRRGENKVKRAKRAKVVAAQAAAAQQEEPVPARRSPPPGPALLWAAAQASRSGGCVCVLRLWRRLLRRGVRHCVTVPL